MTNSSIVQSSSSSNSEHRGIIEPSSRDLVMAIASAADDRKAEDIVILHVEGVSYLADYFTIVTGFSKAQVRAIAESIRGRLETEFDRSCPRIEGQSDGTWILLDYGDAIAHVMMPEEREFYNLEAFWGHAERIEYPGSAPENQPSPNPFSEN
ncbi:ribosome silencing factor [Oscillatoriales cyanobacterium LEGE 11467]|uniref:Ribosomal silencing factor RsfS n=1 Tax=Zarconia navalis LEGE 11467 TaxID=1828826 RepID=A0A928VX39_9CYAN|nr:ribosome silencing factor [Zarconia navalis]MBE9039270.1 ribosome silencing factor [Zarconia navalis LEGE 11467]